MKIKTNLSSEISALLLLKTALLFVIWYVCFSNPVDDHNVKKMSSDMSVHFFDSQRHTHNKVSQHD